MKTSRGLTWPIGFVILILQISAIEWFQIVLGDGPDCRLVTTRPTIDVESYALKNCIRTKFGAYLELNKENYFELKNGIVLPNQSNCYNSTTEPKLVIKFDCGQLELTIEPQEEPFKEVKLKGNFALDDAIAEHQHINFSAPVVRFQPQPCLYYENSLIQSTLIGHSNELYLKDIQFEIHRDTNETNLRKCVKESASSFVLVIFGICAVILIGAAVYSGLRWLSQ